MPFVNVKPVKGQATPEQKQAIMAGLTEVMGRERSF